MFSIKFRLKLARWNIIRYDNDMIRHVFQAVIWYRYDIVNAVDSNMIHYGYAVMDKLEKKIVYNDPDRLGSTHTRKVMAKFYNEEEMYLHNLYQYAIDGK